MPPLPAFLPSPTALVAAPLLALRLGIAVVAPLAAAAEPPALPAGWQLTPAATDLPVRAAHRQGEAGAGVAGYVFRSDDFHRRPGYGGEPLALQIALDTEGRLAGLEVLSQHEPAFADRPGTTRLETALGRYRGRSLAELLAPAAERAAVDGMSGATVSARVLHESVTVAARRVARARLPQLALAPAARLRQDAYRPADWRQLAEAGWIARLTLARRDLWWAFAGSGANAGEPLAAAWSDDPFVELHFARLDAPAIGRNVLGDEAYERLRVALAPGEAALAVWTGGGFGEAMPGVVPAAWAERLSLAAEGRRLALSPLDLGLGSRLADQPAFDDFAVFRVAEDAGEARAWQLALAVDRLAGRDGPALRRSFTTTYRLPTAFFEPASGGPGHHWQDVWRRHAGDLALLALALVVLVAALAARRRLAPPPRLAVLRWTFLAFTLGWLGWQAEGQLSVVNALALVRAAAADLDLSAYLYAPLTVALWGFVAVAALVWGRGAFCGWLCPFGALQEFVAAAAARLGLRPRRLPEAADRRLARLPYLMLAALLAAAWLAPPAADLLAEWEPFRTAINAGFRRPWPYLIYALAWLAAGAVLFKAYCRYACPLGAALALLGRLRRLGWIERRRDCGAPCQRCRHRCRYGAIARDGAIRYADCHACLDCVAIYQRRDACAPLMLADKRLRRALALRVAKVPAERP